MRQFRLTTAVVAILAAGLPGARPAMSAQPPTPAAPAAVRTATTATYYTGHYTLASGRTFYLHAPTAPAGPQPLVVALHAAAWTAGQMQTNTGLTGFSEGRFALAYGEGLNQTWNAGAAYPAQPACCGYAKTGHVDDVTYIRQVIATAEQVTPVDPARVYVVGFSNGAMMAYKFACEAPGVAAGIGVVGGSLLVPCPAGANVLHIHGTSDTTVPQSGVGYEGVAFPSVWTEPLRMPRGALWSLLAFNGGHGWPGWANQTLWVFLAR